MKKFILPLSFIGLFFFAIGFAFGINGFLTPVLKGSMDVTPFAANLLIVFNFLPFLLFGIPAAQMLRRIGYKKTMAVSFALFAIAFALFIPATSMRSLTFFIVACFLSGIANTILQAAVNPYVTLLGPIESAAQRTCIMGICNKLAWPTTTLFMMTVIGKTEVADILLDELYMPFGIIIGIFVLLGILSLLAPLPEVKAEGESEDQDPNHGTLGEADGKSYADYPHLVLGAITLFLYVGVETLSLSTMTDYATSQGLPDVKMLSYLPSLGMIAGYIFGATCIPSLISQVNAMRIFAIIAIIGSILTATLPAQLSAYSITLMGLGCSVMWPALWPMAMADLGNFTKKGAGLLTMAIAGGSALPFVRGLLEQATGSYQQSYWVCVPCFLFIAWYGFAGYKIRKGSKG